MLRYKVTINVLSIGSQQENLLLIFVCVCSSRHIGTTMSTGFHTGRPVRHSLMA
jgi:hypothetical protein